MAVLIPEAAAAVGEGGAAVESTAAGGAASPAAAPKGYTSPKRAAKPKAPTKPKAGKNKAAILPGSGEDKKNKKIRVGGGRNSFGHGHYQPVVLAEFLVAVLIVSVSPLAKGGDATAQAKGGPSPYSTDTMKQLIAIGGTYFVLALLSGGKKTGRYAAWFGALVLLGLGFAELLNGDLKALFGIFAPGSWQGLGAPAAAPAAPGGTVPVPGSDIGQAAAGALTGALGGAAPPDATGLFPTIEPGGQIVPATQSFVSPPPGGNGVTTTTGNDAGVNLA